MIANVLELFQSVFGNANAQPAGIPMTPPPGAPPARMSETMPLPSGAIPNDPSSVQDALTKVQEAPKMPPIQAATPRPVGAPLSISPPAQPAPQQPGGMVDALRSILGGQQQPRMPVATPQIPANDRVPLSMVLRDIMTGAASVDPTAPKLAAFAKGFAGTWGAEEKRRAEAAAAAEKAAQSAFDKSLKMSAESRAERKDTREAETAKYGNMKIVSDVLKNIDPRMTPDQRSSMEKRIREYTEEQSKIFGLSGDALKKEVERYTKQLMNDFTPRQNMPAQPNTAPVAPPTPGAPVKPVAPGTAPAGSTPTTPQQKAPPPAVGVVIDGYRYRGGESSDPKNWEKVS